MKTELNDGEKRVTDVLLSLQTHAFNSLNERRRYEWRLAISLWTASVVLLGFLLKGDVSTLGPRVKGGLTCVVACVVVSHAVWMKGAGRPNWADIHVAYFWEAKTRELLDTKYADELENELKTLRATSGRFWTYSFVFEFSTTLLLAVAITCAVWWGQGAQQRAGSDSSKDPVVTGTVK